MSVDFPNYLYLETPKLESSQTELDNNSSKASILSPRQNEKPCGANEHEVVSVGRVSNIPEGREIRKGKGGKFQWRFQQQLITK